MTDPANDWIGKALSSGRYVIATKLGEGGMGTVYRARDCNIDGDVVVKFPHPSMATDPEFARRFKEEIRSLVRLSHPHIVKVTDVGEADGLPFAVMSFLSGGNLDDRIASGGPDASGGLADWLGGVAKALDHVHSQGYVHRDVKPANILFDAQGHPFLGDFGVVKVLAAAADEAGPRTSLTGAGMVIGTPDYMAPELVLGEPFDGRVDQYALAVTVYEALDRPPAVRALGGLQGARDAHDHPAGAAQRGLSVDLVPALRRGPEGPGKGPRGPLRELCCLCRRGP